MKLIKSENWMSSAAARGISRGVITTTATEGEGGANRFRLRHRRDNRARPSDANKYFLSLSNYNGLVAAGGGWRGRGRTKA